MPLSSMPIMYEKNKNSGAVQLLQSINNVLITNNAPRDYLVLTMSGNLSGTLFTSSGSGTITRKILCCNSNTGGAWIAGTYLPNPTTNTNNACVQSLNLVFNDTEGTISNLTVTKKYLVNVSLNLNSLAISSGTPTFTASLVITDDSNYYYDSDQTNNYGKPFYPECNGYASQLSSNCGTGINMTYVVSGCTAFSLLLNKTAATITTTPAGYDTNLSISVLEI